MGCCFCRGTDVSLLLSASVVPLQPSPLKMGLILVFSKDQKKKNVCRLHFSFVQYIVCGLELATRLVSVIKKVIVCVTLDVWGSFFYEFSTSPPSLVPHVLWLPLCFLV